MKLNGIKVNFLGDSITEGIGASCTENRFTDVFARKAGAVMNNYGIGGTRIARQKAPTTINPQADYCFLDRVEGMDADADLIVVFGGTNDFGHGDAAFGDVAGVDTDEYTFCGAMRSLIERLMAKYPTGHIVFMTPLHRKTERVTTNEFHLPCHPLYDYVAAERRICEAYGVPCLDLYATSGIQPRLEVSRKAFAPDGLHPNDAGAERIADRLIAFLTAL